MSAQNPFGGRVQRMNPGLPGGEVVQSYETYAEAQAAVALLARAEFPVKQLSIVGNELHTVERVTGRMSYARAAITGAASGAWLGIFFGILMFILIGDSVSISAVIAAVLIGAGFGMLFRIATYSLSRRRRDYTSTMQVVAGSYALMVDRELANRARNLLSDGGDARPVHVTDATRSDPSASPSDSADERR